MNSYTYVFNSCRETIFKDLPVNDSAPAPFGKRQSSDIIQTFICEL